MTKESFQEEESVETYIKNKKGRYLKLVTGDESHQAVHRCDFCELEDDH